MRSSCSDVTSSSAMMVSAPSGMRSPVESLTPYPIGIGVGYGGERSV